jgi:phenylpyruvate tautomerase
MPFIQVTSNIALTDAEKSNCLQTLSTSIAELLEKSEGSVMTSWTSAKMTLAGKASHTAFLELRAIRLPADATQRLTAELCERMTLLTGIQPDRIFINFIDIPPTHWGWNKKTFD